MPSDLPACLNRLEPEPGALTKQQTFLLITRLRRSELEKAQCGHRALDFYEALRTNLKP